MIALITQCGKGIKQSQSAWEADDSESNSTLQGKPNSRLEHPTIVPKQPFAFHSDSWTDPPQATAGPYALPKCRMYVYSTTAKPVLLVALATRIPTRRTWVTRRSKTSGGRYVHSSGQLATRLTAYHISRHVASTFKRLTRTTTRYNLIKFNKTGGVSSQPWYLIKLPSVILIVITGM
jgi:hypothetical protein